MIDVESVDGPWPVPDDVVGNQCPGCQRPFERGDVVGVVLIGPGDDPVARRAARSHHEYDGVGVLVHWICATGQDVIAAPEAEA